MALLEDITRQTKQLTHSEQLKLIAYLAEQLRLQQTKAAPPRRWQEIAGAASYPLVGEEAQSWVVRLRQESDEARNPQGQGEA